MVKKMGFLIFVVCSLCFGTVLGTDTYKVAVARSEANNNKYIDLIREAAKVSVDLVVLPSPKTFPSEDALESCLNELDNYDEIVKSVSAAAKEAQIYVVAHLYEKTQCQNREELIRSNLVFNRDGAIISVKPAMAASNCNTTMLKMGQFTADFGVKFGVLMEEDIILNNIKEYNGIKNFVVSGDFVPKTKFLFANQFPSSWAYANKVNVVTSNGIFGSNIEFKRTSNQLILAEVGKHVEDDITQSLITFSEQYSLGDLSQYIIKPLNTEACSHGYTDTVCREDFCCEFYVKANIIVSESKEDVTYGLVAFDGIQELGVNNIGIQTCSIVACAAGLYKRSCFVGSENSTSIKFEKISIKGNFTEDSTQFPTIRTSTQNIFNKENFKFATQNKNAELYNTENVLAFGIFSRVYSRDYETSEFSSVNNTDRILDFSEYISIENVQEFFDYFWIRLRVLIFIVSIYFLEMM